MTRKPLGRGLSALLESNRSDALTSDMPSEETSEIEIDLIKPNPVQPRSHFDERSLDDLANSIRENGVVQPILVRRVENGFELVAGERRLRGARRAGLKRIPAVIRDVPNDKLLELALIENIQREDLNAIEEAQAYKNLIDTVGLTQDALAQQIGRDRSYITNYIRLLRLPEDLQRMVQEGKLSTGHARTLLGTEEVNTQRRVARRVLERGLSVRETERLVRRLIQKDEKSTSVRSASRSDADVNVRTAEAKLRRRLGMKVQIVGNNGRAGGTVKIEYYDEAGLDRLYQLLMANAEESALASAANSAAS